MSSRRRTIHNSIIIALSLLIVMFTINLFVSHNRNRHRTQNTTSPPADWFADEVHIRAMGPTGVRLREAHAKRLVHYNYAKRTDLDMPVVTLYDHTPDTWRLTARAGTAFHGASFTDILCLALHHDVQLSRGKIHPLTVLTDSLTVYPNEQRAISQADVTFVQPGQTLAGHGMIAYLNEERLQLLHQVRGQHSAQRQATQ